MSQTEIPNRPTTAPAPDPELVRGRCPQCGEEMVSSLRYHKGQGFTITWSCFRATYAPEVCDYARTL